MKRFFKFKYNSKESEAPIHRQFVIEVEMEDEQFIKGKVVSKNKWSVMNIGESDIFIKCLLEEITFENAILDFEETSLKN